MHQPARPKGFLVDHNPRNAAERLITIRTKIICGFFWPAITSCPWKFWRSAPARPWPSWNPVRSAPAAAVLTACRTSAAFVALAGRPEWLSYAAHFGEEAPLVGRSGSGTIFFSGCNLSCVFCQNYDISQLDHGREVSPETLAKMMLSLQGQGCHNINFVTPTHVIPQILEALVMAREGGLTVPLVYNSGGYDSAQTLQLLDGIFDIYMPDAKYGSDEMALKYSSAPRYTAFHEKCHQGDAPPGGRLGAG